MASQIESRGYALVAIMLSTSLLLLIGTGVLSLILREGDICGNYKDYITAHYIAEGGLHETLAMMERDPEFGADKKVKSFPLGKGSYRVKVTPGDDGILSVTVNGIMPQVKNELAAEVCVEGSTHRLRVNSLRYKGDL